MGSSVWQAAPASSPRVRGRLGSGPGRPATELLHGAGGEPRDVVVEKEDVEDDDRHGAEDGASHERSPEVDVAANELCGDADARRDLLGGRGEGERVNELVPREREREQDRADEA